MSELTLRTLNRTLLERQLLTRRAARPALDVIRHLVAVQGQEPNWPYVGLWTRIAGFRREELEARLADRTVVRGALIRTTQHLATAEDFCLLRPLVQPVLDRAPRQGYRDGIAGLDLAELAAAARELLAGQTLTRPQLGRLLAERFPGRPGGALAGSAHFLVPMVHPPPSGRWGAWGGRGSVPCALARDWIGADLAAKPDAGALARRYLAAFGPASVADLQAWSGLARLREVVEGQRAGLRVFRDEKGRELFDLPDAPIADPDQPVPVRFLPAYDNLLVGHADRSRLMAPGDRRLVAPGHAVVRPTFLLDGLVGGTWSLRDGDLTVEPFRELAGPDAEAVLAEARDLLAFIGPGAAERRVTLAAPPA